MSKTPPLRQTYCNEKARIEEHRRFMREAQRQYGRLVCPDCYLPPGRCLHLDHPPSTRRRNPGGPDHPPSTRRRNR